MSGQIPDYHEILADERGAATRLWYIYWKALSAALTPGQLPGTNTNDSASAGNVGEYISSEVLQADAVSLTTNVDKSVTSISLTAGDWDVWINALFLPQGATTSTGQLASVSLSSATLSNSPISRVAFLPMPTAGFLGGGTFGVQNIVVGPTRLSLAATTTVYFIVKAVFSGGTMSAFGHLQARRRR